MLSTSLVFIPFLSAVVARLSTTGKYAPKRMSPLLGTQQEQDSPTSVKGYPCSVTLPSQNYDSCTLSLTSPTHVQISCDSPQTSVSKNITEVFERSVSSPCRGRLVDWVSEYWRPSVQTASRLVDVIEYEINEEFSPEEGPHWEGDPRSFSFLPYEHILANHAGQWIEGTLKEPRHAAQVKPDVRPLDTNELPKNVVFKNAFERFWRQDPFVKALWEQWQSYGDELEWNPCILRAPTRRSDGVINTCSIGILDSTRVYLWCEDFGLWTGLPKLFSLASCMEILSSTNILGKCYGALVALLQSAINLELQGLNITTASQMDPFYKAIERDIENKDEERAKPFVLSSPDTVASYILEVIHNTFINAI